MPRRVKKEVQVVDQAPAELAVVPPPTWENILAAARISEVKRTFIYNLMPHVLTYTDNWAKALGETTVADTSELDLRVRLKLFFARNPFGCRNKLMIEMLCMIHGFKPEEIAPPDLAKIEDEDGTDGANEDKVPMGIFDLATKGCFYKCLDSRIAINSSSKIGIFWKQGNSRIYTFVEGFDSLQRGDILNQMRRHSPDLKHFRPATPQEIVAELIFAQRRALEDYVQKLFCEDSERKLLGKFIDLDTTEYEEEEPEPEDD